MLPKIIDPRRSADQDIEYRESMQERLLPRFSEAIEALHQPVDVGVRVFRDEQSRIRVAGEATATVDLVCQRCMNPMQETIRAEFDLVAVYGEAQAKALPKEYDAWVVEESADLHQMIEDELLLAMPIVAYHDISECSAPDIDMPLAQIDTDIEEQTAERQSPFAVLKDLTSKPG